MRRVLFDENMPRQLRRDLQEFVIRTVQEEGWAGLENGNLLRRFIPQLREAIHDVAAGTVVMISGA